MRTYRMSLTVVLGLILAGSANGQTKLSTKWEELTAADFRDAIGKAQGTCFCHLGFWKNTDRTYR